MANKKKKKKKYSQAKALGSSLCHYILFIADSLPTPRLLFTMVRILFALITAEVRSPICFSVKVNVIILFDCQAKINKM